MEDIVIVVEGNIGSGKSTLGKILEKRLGSKLYTELKNPITLRMLESFYMDKKRYSFMLQVHFLNERFKMIKDIFKHGGGILDRSIYGDKVFASVLHEDGDMTEEEFTVYSDLLENMLEHAKKPRLLIFLDADIKTCMERIKARSRAGENLISADYLIRLERKYKDWLEDYSYSRKLIIPYSKMNIFEEEDRVVQMIKNFIEEAEESE